MVAKTSWQSYGTKLCHYHSMYIDRQQIAIDDMQFGFMKVKGTTDAIFMARQMQENFRVKGKKLFLVLWIWRKLLI